MFGCYSKVIFSFKKENIAYCGNSLLACMETCFMFNETFII